MGTGRGESLVIFVQERGRVTGFVRLEYAMPCLPNTVLRSRAAGGAGRAGGNDRPWRHPCEDGRRGRSEIGAGCTACGGRYAPTEPVASGCAWRTRGEGIFEHVQLNFLGWTRRDKYVAYVASICVITLVARFAGGIRSPPRLSRRNEKEKRVMEPWNHEPCCDVDVCDPDEARNCEGGSPALSRSGSSSADADGRTCGETLRWSKPAWARGMPTRFSVRATRRWASGAGGPRIKDGSGPNQTQAKVGPTQSFGGYAAGQRQNTKKKRRAPAVYFHLIPSSPRCLSRPRRFLPPHPTLSTKCPPVTTLTTLRSTTTYMRHIHTTTNA